LYEADAHTCDYLLFWPVLLEVKIDIDERKVLPPLGLLRMGSHLEQLRFLVATSSSIKDILHTSKKFEVYEATDKFEKIGKEAKAWHELLSKRVAESRRPPITGAERVRLQSDIAAWKVLAEEKMKELYLAAPSTNIAPDKLIRGLTGFLEEDLAKLLTDQERGDLAEACNCILVGSNTAAEFMSLRAAESLLRRWYEKRTYQNLERKSWGFVLDKLTEAYPDRKRPNEIALLAYLKQRRDEIAHPQRSSTPQEAEATLLTVFSLIQALKDYL